MLRASSAVAKAGVREQVEMERLISHLKALGYLPVMRSIYANACTVLGLPEPGEQATAEAFSGQAQRLAHTWARPDIGVFGEVLLLRGTICIVSPHTRESLRASVVGHGDQEEGLRRFCGHLEAAIRERFDGRRVKGMDFTWSALSERALSYEMRRYAAERDDPFLGLADRQAGKFQSTEAEYAAEDAECSRLLVDGSVRSFVLTLAKVSKIRKKDAADAAEPQLLDRLLSVGLVAQEYLLTCRQDQHTICVMATADGVRKEPTASLRCTLCGRPFADENLQEIYGLTDRGKRLLDGSLWMHVWVTELLLENGVRKGATGWSFGAQGEELDVMVEDFDSRAFFELKDREFGLGDAYPFVYRLTKYGGRVGLVATMDQVSPDARAFLEEQKRRRDFPSEIRYLEGAAGIRDGVAGLVRDLSLSQVRRLVRPFSDRLGFDLWPLIESRIGSDTGAASPTGAAPSG